MRRLMKAIFVAAAATGAAYLTLRMTRIPDSSTMRTRRDPLLDDGDLSDEEKQQILRELSAFL